MFKILTIGLLIWILVSLIRNKRNQSSKQQSSQAQNNTTQERIVPCQYCGVHIPESTAINHQQQFFCSQQHVEAYTLHTKP